MRTETFMEHLRSFVGVPSDPVVARDPVNVPMIRHWCDAIGDTNPVYADASFKSVHEGIVAPPAMLHSWTLGGLAPAAGSRPRAQNELLAALDEAGFSSVVATNCEQEYMRYLRPGDVLTAEFEVEAVSEEKKTALGNGHFVDSKTVWRDAMGEVVGVQKFRLLKFSPAAKSASRTPPPMSADTAFFWEGAKQGKLLIQRCSSCGELRHPPRPMCAKCRSLEWDTVESAGRGEVFSFVVHHHPAIPGFEIPYVVALIELAEGTRLVSNVVGVAPSDVRIGMQVSVRFENVGGDVALPMFEAVTA